MAGGGAHLAREIASQPETWERVLAEPDRVLETLPQHGVPVVAAGCGTSYYIAASYARRREATGAPTRAAVASELDTLRPGEVLLLLSRSGTTRDVLELARRFAGSTRLVGVVGAPGTPLVSACDAAVLLDYADEESVVQTRFATAALTLLRRSLGEDLAGLPDGARRVLAAPAPVGEHDHVVFLGTGPAVTLAAEAALKCLEAAGVWAESYPVAEYLHGPIAAAGERTLVWSLSAVPDRVASAVQATGATLRLPRTDLGRADAQLELVGCQLLALELARRRGRDPDHPAHLGRSVV